MKEKVQSFGRFLSAMVMPNIGAFIAWGLITALFIEAGWLPNAQLATIVGPMLAAVDRLYRRAQCRRAAWGSHGRDRDDRCDRRCTGYDDADGSDGHGSSGWSDHQEI